MQPSFPLNINRGLTISKISIKLAYHRGVIAPVFSRKWFLAFFGAWSRWGEMKIYVYFDLSLADVIKKKAHFLSIS